MKKVILFLGCVLFCSSLFAQGKALLRVPETISAEIPDDQLAKVTFQKNS